MADTYRYTNNNPTATATANEAALASGTAVDSQGNKITGFGTPVATPAPTPAPPSPYQNGKDPSGGLTPGYSLLNGQLTYTGTNQNGTTVVDPLTAYYQNFVADQSLRDQINKNMNDALAAIDQKYVQITADRLGQTRAINARGGLAGSDFGNTALTNTQTTTDQQKEAEKTAVRATYEAQLNDLAANEIKARQDNAKGQAEAAQAQYEKNKQDAQNLIVNLAKTNQTISDAQKEVLARNAGYDSATFELVYNANKPSAQKIDYQFANLGNGKGLFYGVDPVTGQLKQVQADINVPPNYTLTIAPDGTPLIFNKDTGQAQIATGFNDGQFAKPGSGSAKVTSEDATSAITSKWQTEGFIQGNGKVSPKDYKDAKSWWTQKGLSPSDFDNVFSNFIDTSGDNWKEDYGYKGN